MKLEAKPLKLGDVSLRPPDPSHYEGLKQAANDEATWRYYPYRADGETFDAFFNKFYLPRHQPPKEIHHTVFLGDEIVGVTCFLAVVLHSKTLEIGGTWYSKEARGSVVNPTCKYLLLERAFECGFRRVEIKTDSNNAHSRAAIEKLGAKFEGIFRKHMILHDGRSRDTAWYSIIDDEWPEVQERLKNRLSKLGVKI